MSEFPWESIIVVTYGAIFTAALGGVLALFRRMGRVEEAGRRVEGHADRLDKAVEEIRLEVKQQGKDLSAAMTDLRVHMAEEGRNVDRLETLIKDALVDRQPS
jgi:hypothetical protein